MRPKNTLRIVNYRRRFLNFEKLVKTVHCFIKLILITAWQCRPHDSIETTYNYLNHSTNLSVDRSASFSARPKGDIQFQRPAQSSSSTSQLQSQGDSSQSDFHQQGSSSTITSSIGGSSGVIAGSPQGNQGADVGDHHTPVDGKRGKQKTAQPNARSESYKECSPKRSRTNRPKSDPSLYE